ncbi:MAG: hypothetical protein KY468_19405 [Armatimonadetes bacterium]|nr:hypothetical protein [Armatimonadota bacterium]
MTAIYKRWGGAAALAGGSLWVLHYLLHVGYGLSTGRNLFEAPETAPGRLDLLAFFGAYLMLSASLLILSRTLKGRQRGWGYAGAAFAGVAAAAGLAGVRYAFFPVGPEESHGPLGIAGKIGIITLFLSAIFTGNGLLRAGTVPRWTSLTVLLFGWLTFPAAMAIMPFEAILPPYWVSELHFAVVGIIWAVVGVTLLSMKCVTLPAPERVSRATAGIPERAYQG